MDLHQFRLALGVLDVTPPVLESIVRETMHQAERDTQRALDWVGAVHQDTPTLHAHVLLRGRDRDGKDLYLTRSYLTQGLRYRLQELATLHLGRVRSPERIRVRAQERLTTLERDMTHERRQDARER